LVVFIVVFIRDVDALFVVFSFADIGILTVFSDDFLVLVLVLVLVVNIFNVNLRFILIYHALVDIVAFFRGRRVMRGRGR
jgi:hypothetical protein